MWLQLTSAILTTPTGVKRRISTESLKFNLPNWPPNFISCALFFPANFRLFFKVNFAFRVHNPTAINIFVSTSSRCGWAGRASDTNQADVQAPSPVAFLSVGFQYPDSSNNEVTNVIAMTRLHLDQIFSALTQQWIGHIT